MSEIFSTCLSMYSATSPEYLRMSVGIEESYNTRVSQSQKTEHKRRLVKSVHDLQYLGKLGRRPTWSHKRLRRYGNKGLVWKGHSHATNGKSLYLRYQQLMWVLVDASR